jgi:signal transduction histidine kinase
VTTQLRLTSWFRGRMLPLVLVSSLVGAISAPVAYHVQKRSEIVAVARGDARRVAAAMVELVQQRPQLWRYDTAKLVERLAAEGLSQIPVLVVHDGRGLPVPVGKGAVADPGALLWGRADVLIAGRREASVWVGSEQRPLWRGTLALGLLSALVSVILGAVLYLLPVRAIAAAERRISGLMGQLTLTLREEERGRIARDLHDGAGQALTAARLHLLALRRGADQATLDRIEPIAHHLDEALDEVRRSTAALMPPALAELGLKGAIERHCEAFSAASGLPVRCEVDEGLPPFEGQIETSCYRIVQEALTNTARHAGARQASVRLELDQGELLLRIDDDGQGIDERHASGVGLASLQERARLLGGSAVFSSLHPGTRLEVRLPVGSNHGGDA